MKWQYADVRMNTRSEVVHPLVLLSVTDHHARTVSRSTNKRVVGVLLGQNLGKTINVANSFGIPFEEDEKDSKTWFLDHNYIESMYTMFKKVNGMHTHAPCPCAILTTAATGSEGADSGMVSHRSQTTRLRLGDQRTI